MSTKEGSVAFINCPHCDVSIEIKKINCGIFRCGVYKGKKKNYQIAPHAPKEFCEKLVAEGRIWGCGKPFRLVKSKDNRVESCDYI